MPPARPAAPLTPDFANALSYGLARLEAGEAAEAVAALTHAASLNPAHAETQYRLGLALEAAGQGLAALRAFDAATALRPRFTEAWFRAGAVAFTLGHRAEALGCFRRAMAGGAKTSLGKLAAARVLILEGKEAEAVRRLRQLLALDPRQPVALDLLGNLLAEAGEFAAAYECFAQALAAAPRMAGSWYDLVRCRRLGEADWPLIERMRAALDLPLQPEQRLRLHLALGKAYDDLGRRAEAAAAFGAAAALRTALAPFDIALFETQTARIIAAMTPARVAAAAAQGRRSRRPIFVTGMPRSGTTLTEQILSAHPAVAAGGEMNFWTARGAAWFRDGMPSAPGDAFVTRAADDYLAQLQALDGKAAHVTDKMPFNFLWAGLIHMALPEALILHCARDARDTALSIHQTYFSLQLAFPTDGAALPRYLRCHDALVAHWRAVLPAERFFSLSYEALTASPEAEIRRMLEAAGLAFDPACLHPERNTVSVRTASRHQARSPIGRGSVGRWRNYASHIGFLAELG